MENAGNQRLQGPWYMQKGFVWSVVYLYYLLEPLIIVLDLRIQPSPLTEYHTSSRAGHVKTSFKAFKCQVLKCVDHLPPHYFLRPYTSFCKTISVKMLIHLGLRDPSSAHIKLFLVKGVQNSKTSNGNITLLIGVQIVLIEWPSKHARACTV